MFRDELIKLSDTLHKTLIQIPSTKRGSLSDNRDKNNLVKFYCTLQEFGHQIFHWEVETFEIVLGRKGFGYGEIMNIVGMVFTAEHPDFVLTNRDHFENAVQLLNDLVLDTSTTEYQPPHYILWATVGLITLYNSQNIPIIGDAAVYVAESLKHYGFTQVPVFFVKTPIETVFGELDEEYAKILKRMDFETFANACLSIKEPKNGFENYLKMHAPMIAYVDDKFKETLRQAKSIINKG